MNDRVPVSLIEPHLRQYLGTQADPEATMLVLAERAQTHYDNLRACFNGRAVTLAFDVADRLMCAMHKVHLWRQDPELREVYLSLDLAGEPRPPALPVRKRRCAAPGCHVVFELDPPTDKRGRAKTARGHNRKWYCSRSCANRASQMRRGVRATPADSRDFVCRNGHERTPENTEYLSNGTRRCRECNRQRTQEFRARQRAQRAQQLEAVAA